MADLQSDDLPELRLSRQDPADRPSRLPWILAGGVVVILLAVLIYLGRHSAQPTPRGNGLAPPDPYAVSLPITDLKMSEASNFAGGKVTYLDGQIANRGQKTITGVTVQVAFKNALGELAQKETVPLALIRTHDPYVDTQSVNAAPIKPGEQREFRLIFDHVIPDWNQEFPEVRVIGAQGK